MLNKRLKFKQIPLKLKYKILSGCGIKGGILDVPDFIFTASCNHHDFKYWRGKGPHILSLKFWRHPFKNLRDKIIDRQVADLQFLLHMLKDAESYENEKLRDKYINIAYIYFKAVRMCGWMFYSWRDEKTIDFLKKFDEKNKIDH